MAINKTECFVIACDGCGDKYQYDDEGWTPHFDTKAEAQKALIDDAKYGGQWYLNDEEVLCPECRERNND